MLGTLDGSAGVRLDGYPEGQILVLKGAKFKCFGPCGLVITFDHKPTPPAPPGLGMVE